MPADKRLKAWNCAQGDVLYSNYGNKSNEELILGYGFAVANNQADFFHVMLGLGDKQSAESSGTACMLICPCINPQAHCSVSHTAD